MPDNKKE
ncbi:hypothetical protein CGLO_18318 [Colletotrichum gloeosporioides Cg-14]|nr:hypothetical protein CGLO_18318 [Colletotrichum gloeosporioides Cg-14]